MSHWTPGEWGIFLVGAGTLITGVISAVGAVLANLARIKGQTNEKKIEENTELTKAGTYAAATNAAVAAKIATAAKNATEGLAKDVASQLNGALDNRMNKIAEAHIKKLEQLINTHTDQDEKNMLEVRNALIELRGAILDKK